MDAGKVELDLIGLMAIVNERGRWSRDHAKRQSVEVLCHAKIFVRFSLNDTGLNQYDLNFVFATKKSYTN